MRQRIHLILLFIALLMTSKSAADGVDKLNCPVVRIEAERLPDMNVPRSGHSAILVNGEVTVLGGHTSGFVLTPTAEYLKDGEWHQLQTVYNHDGGISIVMKSGKVLLAGGFKDNLGIGQSYEVELYDPVTHQFNGFGCLDKKRVSGAAVELDSGRVMIAGNWYANDAIEMFDGKATFSHVKSVAQSRSLPHVFRTSNDNALIVAGYDFHGNPIDTIVIDRLYGEPFRNELFDNWKPLQYDLVQHSDDSFIGDEAKGMFRYLMPVENKDGQLAIIDVRDTVFTPLPTSTPVPMKSQWGAIRYHARLCRPSPPAWLRGRFRRDKPSVRALHRLLQDASAPDPLSYRPVARGRHADYSRTDRRRQSDVDRRCGCRTEQQFLAIGLRLAPAFQRRRFNGVFSSQRLALVVVGCCVARGRCFCLCIEAQKTASAVRTRRAIRFGCKGDYNATLPKRKRTVNAPHLRPDGWSATLPSTRP